MEQVPDWALRLIEDVGEMKGTTRQILDQTTKTNGRVTKLEGRVDCLESKSDNADGKNEVKKCIWRKAYSIGEKVFIIIVGIVIGKVIK